MKFGKVDNPEVIDYSLPEDHPSTGKLFASLEKVAAPKIFIGAPKWNKKDLRNFYPRGTKNELEYYSSQFNSIELNATFYQRYPIEQYQKWHNITEKGFVFFPKLTQQISHYRQLKNVNELVDEYLVAVSGLEEKLGTIFLQLNNRYSPKHLNKLVDFVDHWPEDVKLAIEVRHEDWFTDKVIYDEYCELLASKNISNILVDTPGRRDILHMRMTGPQPFIRFVGAVHGLDYERLDDWVNRIEKWVNEGMQELAFFIHQHADHESPLLGIYLTEKLNERLGLNMRVPQTIE